jgi:putative transposase
MRKSKFSESQIVAILKEGEAGVPVAEVCRKHGISAATYYAWKSKYAGATVSDLTRMRELEAENARLKRMYADLAMENAAIKEVLGKNPDAAPIDNRNCRRLQESVVCLTGELTVARGPWGTARQ